MGRSVVGARRARGRRVPRPVVLTALVLAAVLLLSSGWVAVRAVRARAELDAAAVALQQVRDAVTRGDMPAAQDALGRARQHIGAARGDASDPVWRGASAAPLVGANLAAVTTVTEALDDLARDGLPALIEAAHIVHTVSVAPSAGHLDIDALAGAAPQVARADAVMRSIRDRVAAVDTGALVSTVASGVDALRAQLDAAASLSSTAVLATSLLPPMLGQRRPRTYLMLFQNLAEPRASGGEMGAYAVLRVDRGMVRIVAQGAASGLGVFTRPVLPLDPAMRRLYGDRPAIFPADINATPHFPTTAALARAMYRARTGVAVDGVFATDPVALSYLLAATGPVAVAGTTLTAQNVVQALLSDVYARMPTSARQDEFFADTARAVFDRLVGGQLDRGAALAGLARAAGERRLLAWSADPAEEARLAPTMLGGVLPDDGAIPTVGLFLNDGTGAKLGYYLTRATEVRPGGCRDDGRRELTVRLSLGLPAPSSGLPDYVTGVELVVPRYTLRTVVMVFAPTGGTVVGARRDGTPVPLGAGVERGRAVGVVAVDLTPQAKSTVDFTVLTGVPPDGARGGYTPHLWTTPGVRAWPTTVEPTAYCPGPVRR